MKSLLTLGLFLCVATLSTGCCHSRCGSGCGSPMMFSGCSPCGGVSSCGSVSPCGGYSTGCDSCGSSGPLLGAHDSGAMMGPMMTGQYSEGTPVNGPHPIAHGNTPMPSTMIGSGELFTQPLPPPLPSNGIASPSQTLPVSSGSLSPMSYQTFQPQPIYGGQMNGYCPTCNH